MLIQNLSSVGDFQYEHVAVCSSVMCFKNKLSDKGKLILIIMYLWYLITKD